MSLQKTIQDLEKSIPNPTKGLPQDIFYMISRLTPLVNVDLLIQNEKNQTLLVWRDDQFVGKGWHLPGGIIRVKERFETRIQKVAQKEIGTTVSFQPIPIAIHQIICKQATRGHFISFLYKCFLSSSWKITNSGMSSTTNGYKQWHASCPNNLIAIHNLIYRNYICGKKTSTIHNPYLICDMCTNSNICMI